MRTLAIVNQKGGSGKTTTAVNLSAALGEAGRRVLLVDMDPQAAASEWLGVNGAGRGLLDILLRDGRIADIIMPTNGAGIDMVPSSAELAKAERVMSSRPGADVALRRVLGNLPSNRWDYVLVDCPSTLGLLTMNGLTAANEVVIPVECHVLGVRTVTHVLETIQAMGRYINPSLKLSAIVANRLDRRSRYSQHVLRDLRSRFGHLVCDTCIPEDMRIAKSPMVGRPIIKYAPKSPGAWAYRALAAEIEGKASSSS